MDAFSSDSVPVHLLTAEAIADEIRITKPDGLLVFHISNRYYDLSPAIAAAVTAQGLTILEKWHQPGAVKEPGETPSRWLAASRDAGDARRSCVPRAGRRWPPADRPFTDDYADLLRYLNLGGGQPAAPGASVARSTSSPSRPAGGTRVASSQAAA